MTFSKKFIINTLSLSRKIQISSLLLCVFMSACATTPPKNKTSQNTNALSNSSQSQRQTNIEGQSGSSQASSSQDSDSGSDENILVSNEGLITDRGQNGKKDGKKKGVIIPASPILDPARDRPIPAPPEPNSAAPETPIYELAGGFEILEDWHKTDLRASFSSFMLSCQSWEKAEQSAFLNPKLSQYGRYSDWMPACIKAKALAKQAGLENFSSPNYKTLPYRRLHRFFEKNFTPVTQSTPTSATGLLTGYYEPELEVRLLPTQEFHAPILAKPEDERTVNLPREKLSAISSRVIAYGRPIDVFFLQIQGSGRLRFKDGQLLRAGYAANNGKPYKSIGKILIERGELSKDQASKDSIEDWMKKNGRKAARDLMNENPRYIFFAEQSLGQNKGPRGAMQVPLTAMGSMAVDPRYYPYGMPIWVETRLPQKGRDFRGKAQSILLMAQDTGSAIKGPMRGDIFFGSGDAAGARAGVMKHQGKWAVFLPKALALRNQSAPSS